jgi:flagellar biosynthesis/type III secretory pathway M-ring protein FliF/YscJ
MVFILFFVIRPLVKNIMTAEPPRRMAGVHVTAGPAGESHAEQYARETAAMMKGAEERPLTESEITQEMARADAKQFADILRNWIK